MLLMYSRLFLSQGQTESQSVISIIEACQTGNVGVVQKLLKRGADPNQTDDEVRSLTSAVQYSNIQWWFQAEGALWVLDQPPE